MKNEAIKCSFCNKKELKLLVSTEQYNILECQKCKIAFTTPVPTLPDYANEDFHNKNKIEGKFKYVEDLPIDWQELIEIQKDILLKHLPERASILELGCGEGILLYELFKEGYNTKGIEASYSGAKRGQMKGLNIQQGYFESQEPNTIYNCIIMSQVLEHIPDIEDVLLKIKKLIPNGYLLLTQANYNGLIPKVQKHKWYAWVPDQHLWHFTLRGLTELLANYGFNLVDYKYNSLVHPHGKLYKISKVLPKLQDQFTALYKIDQ